MRLKFRLKLPRALKPMEKRRHINAEPGAERLRSSVAAATEPVRAAAHTVEEQVVWRGSDWARDQAGRAAEWARDTSERLRPHLEAVSWPFEIVVWLFERWVAWPIQRRTSISRQVLGAGALAALAVALIAFTVLTVGGGVPSPSKRVVATAPVSAPTKAPIVPIEAPAETGVLKGAAPSFGVGNGVGLGSSSEGGAGTLSSSETGTSAAAIEPEGEAATTSASDKPVPAGPTAMKVARRFAEAFVLYEIGKKPERTAAAFEETTSARLETALEERPPRQPAGVQVPEARVLNLVPGPRSGSAYTVSASLLRLGVTSELRLLIEKQNGDWVVTDVRG
jgi:hypothetical protein